MNTGVQIRTAFFLAIMGGLAWSADTRADCIDTLSCATLRPDTIGDVLTLRPGSDDLAIRAGLDPQDFLTMEAVQLGFVTGECGDINEKNKPASGDKMTVTAVGNGGYSLALTAAGATAPKLQVALQAHHESLNGVDQIYYLSGNYAGRNDTYEFVTYLLDRYPYSSINFQKQYRLEVFQSKCIAPRPETAGNIYAIPPVPSGPIVFEGPIGQGGEPPWPR
jgi:hypothetical protein